MPVLIPSNFRPGPARTSVRIPVGERGGVATWRASDGAASLLFMPRKVEGGEGDRGSRGGGEVGEGGEGVRGRQEAEETLESLDSLRQSLLGAEEGREEVGSEREADGSGER